MMLFAQAHAVQYTGIVLGIGLDTGKLHNIIPLQEFQHLLVQPDFLDTASAVGKEDLLSKLRHYLGQFLYDTLAENDAGRSLILKVLHILLTI